MLSASLNLIGKTLTDYVVNPARNAATEIADIAGRVRDHYFPRGDRPAPELAGRVAPAAAPAAIPPRPYLRARAKRAAESFKEIYDKGISSRPYCCVGAMDIRYVDGVGNSPLNTACKDFNPYAIRALLIGESDPNQRNNVGKAALHMLVSGEHEGFNYEVKVLNDHREYIPQIASYWRLREYEVRNFIDYRIAFVEEMTIIEKVELIRIITTQFDADPNLLDANNVPPLSIDAEHIPDPRIIRAFLDRGASIDPLFQIHGRDDTWLGNLAIAGADFSQISNDETREWAITNSTEARRTRLTFYQKKQRALAYHEAKYYTPLIAMILLLSQKASGSLDKRPAFKEEDESSAPCKRT